MTPNASADGSVAWLQAERTLRREGAGVRSESTQSIASAARRSEQRRIAAPSRRAASVAVGLVAILGTVACSDDSDAKKSTAKTTTTIKANEYSDVSGKITIADQLLLDIQYADFLRYANAAKFTSTLEGKGPFTVLIPDPKAFGALSAANREKLLEDPDGDLTALLKRHTLAKRLSYLELLELGGTKVETLGGTKLDVVVKGPKVTIGGAPVTKHDINASNGVIHMLGSIIKA